MPESSKPHREKSIQLRLFGNKEMVKEPLQRGHIRRQMLTKENPKDKILLCWNCKREFMWTAEEQELYRKHDYTTPRHCPMCRIGRYGKTKRRRRTQSG